jgi:hypothetical protein
VKPRHVHRGTKQNYTMQDYSIERSGIQNLDFTGELIGQSAGPNPDVKIYRTKAGKFIGQLHADVKFSMAQPFDNPALLINWFKSVNGGFSISSEMEDAIEDAANHDDSFKAAWNVHVD